MTPATACGVCGATTVETVYDLGVPVASTPRYRVVRCTGCGVARTDPPPSADVRKEFYDADYRGGTAPKLVGPVERVRRVFARARARSVLGETPAGARVLDVGCGDGKLAAAMLATGMRVVGIEGSDGPRRRAVANIGGRVLNADVTGLPFADGTFDVVVIWHVLEHLPQPRRTVGELVRCLRPGGTLVVAVPDLSGLPSRIGRGAWLGLDVERHLYHFTPSGLGALLSEHALAVRRRRHLNLELMVIDVFDSALGRLGLGRFGLYGQLGSGVRRGARALVSAVLASVGLPLALIATLAAAGMGRGTDVQMWARKPATHALRG